MNVPKPFLTTDYLSYGNQEKSVGFDVFYGTGETTLWWNSWFRRL